MAAMLQRYRAGERELVWNELLTLGEKVRQEPYLTESIEVARETMFRAKENIQLLRDRLYQIGYRFAYPSEVFVPPGPEIAARIAYLEKRAGSLPISLRVWYEIVGSVNFIGTHPHWDPKVYADPLVVDPIEFALEEYSDWRESCKEYSEVEIGPYNVPIAPDEYHKTDIRNAPQHSMAVYSIVMPSLAVDSVVGEEPHHTTLVNYLRPCFRWGGFPGFEHAKEYPRKDLLALTQDLLPL